MLTKLTPAVRKRIYLLATALLAVLAGYGLVTAEDAARIGHLVEALLALVTAMAAANTPASKG